MNVYTLYEQGYRAEDIDIIKEKYYLTEAEAQRIYNKLLEIETDSTKSLYELW